VNAAAAGCEATARFQQSPRTQTTPERARETEKTGIKKIIKNVFIFS